MDNVGTDHLQLNVRTFADPRDSDDVKAANALQDTTTEEQANAGAFEVGHDIAR